MNVYPVIYSIFQLNFKDSYALNVATSFPEALFDFGFTSILVSCMEASSLFKVNKSLNFEFCDR